jgi:hypothetical protein
MIATYILEGFFKKSIRNETPSQTITRCSVMRCHLSYMGSVNRSITVLVGLGKKARPCLQITKAKRTGGVAQVVEHLSSKLNTLSSKLQYCRKKKKLIKSSPLLPSPIFFSVSLTKILVKKRKPSCSNF